MKTLYLLLCAAALAGTFHLAGELTQALQAGKAGATAAAAALPAETGSSPPPRLSQPAAARPRGDQTQTNTVTKADAASAGSPAPASTGNTPDSQDILSRVDQLLKEHDQQVRPSPDGLSAADGDVPPPKSVRPPTIPRRHAARTHAEMLTPGNFEYLGAFRLPHVRVNNSTFAYGGWALAWRPASQTDGDAEDDSLPGSLYIVGHREHQKVAEISIPKPVISGSALLDPLPVARVLQPFEDVTGGLLREWNAVSATPFHIGGLSVVGDLLHWTVYKYYNVDGIDYPSHGTTGLNLAASLADGPWHLGPMNSGAPEWHSYKHAGYILQIPAASRTWFGGKNLISGLQISTGLQFSSQGPALFAYQLPDEGTPANTSLSAIPLAWYSESAPLPQHTPADRWTGAAWLTLGNKEAVIVAGRKGLGPGYYGEARPGDCSQDKGYHAAPYEAQMLFYSPASLIHAAYGQLPAHALQPWLRWDREFDGGSLSQYLFRTCSQEVGGLAYDAEHQLIYLVQISAGCTSDNEYEPLPVIHVFHLVE